MAKSKDSWPAEATTADVVRVTGLPRRTLANLHTAGVIQPIRRGVWPFPDVVVSIFHHLNTRTAGSTARGDLARVQTQLKTLELRRAESELIPYEQARFWTEWVVRVFLQELASLPGALASKVVRITDMREAHFLVRQECLRARQAVGDAMLAAIKKLSEPEQKGRRRR